MNLKTKFNGLQVNGGGGVFDREFTKSLMIRDFNDALKNPFRYLHLFQLHTLLSKKILKITMHDLQQRLQSLRCYIPPPH